MAIYLNGEIPAPSLKLNFVDNEYIDGYRSLFATAGRINLTAELTINLVVVFLDCKHFSSLPWGASRIEKNGNSRANIEFRAPIPYS